jgi:hypothetical protein
MRLFLSVEYLDGTKSEAVVTTVDQVAFEDTFDKSVQRLFDDFRLKDIAWLAWRSLHRAGATSADFDAWLENVDGVSFGKVEEPAPLEETTTSTGESST